MCVLCFASRVKAHGTSEGEMAWAQVGFGARIAVAVSRARAVIAVSWVNGVSAAALCLDRTHLRPLLRRWR
jgi:hypothetical protein